MLLILIIWVGCAIACRKLAAGKNKNENAWMVAGLVFGIAPLILIALLPGKPKQGFSNEGSLASKEPPKFGSGLRFSDPAETRQSNNDKHDGEGFNPPTFGQ